MDPDEAVQRRKAVTHEETVLAEKDMDGGVAQVRRLEVAFSVLASCLPKVLLNYMRRFYIDRDLTYL